MKAVEIIGINYTYGDGTVALKDFDLSVEKGERIAILGPNGAGKSTLLKIMGGLIFPSGGKVRIFGKEISKKNTVHAAKRVGMLFQDPDDQIFMPTVWDDIAFGPINMDLGEVEVKKRVRDAIRRTDLVGFEERTAHHLSYGEKKRVAIAGIIAMKPDLLLLDEPTANLDPQSREKLINIINKMNNTVIIATHNLNTVIRMAEKAVVLDTEKIAFGTMREIFSDRKIMRRARLVAPDISDLFMKLRKNGYEFDELPITVDDALRCIKGSHGKNKESKR